MPLDEIISMGFQLNSPIMTISEKMDPENVKTFAKKIRKRLDTQKFRNYWESLNSEENKAEQTNIDQSLPKNVYETELKNHAE